MANLLVVDDDRSIRRTLEKFLGELGYDVTTASTGTEGREKMATERPDLVLLDLNLPGMGGLEILQSLKGAGELPSTIVISARGDMKSTIQAIQHGAYDYLHKPLDIDKLKLTIERALQSQALKRRLAHMVSQASSDFGMDQIIGESPAIREVFKTIAAATTTRATVLITGESGTGKELVARAIHYNSFEAAEPFVAVNCSAISPNLLESELFGHAKGAFTGARESQEGRFQLAGEGTLFLDEIGEVSLDIQVKLLRVLQERVFERVGSPKAVPLKARIIAATNRTLEDMVKEGTFREDLYYRLKVVGIHLPPLRDRQEDLSLLIDHLLAKVSKTLHKPVYYISEEARERLLSHHWPGNVRELENTLTRAVVLSRGEVLDAADLPLPTPGGDSDHGHTLKGPPKPRELSTEGLTRLKDVERLHVVRMLARADYNKRQASELLGMSRPTLDKKIHDYGITKEETEAVALAFRGH